MARVFITSVYPVSKGIIGMIGFLDNRLTDRFLSVNADQVPYDPASATSIRQQVLDQSAVQINAALTLAGYPEEANIVPADIEWVI